MIRLITTMLLCALLLVFGGCFHTKDTVDELSINTPLPEEIQPVVLTDFVLGPGDIIEISVWRHEDLSRKYTIGQTGTISFPLIGTVQAGGSSVVQLNEEIAGKLSKYIKNPQVSINTISQSSAKIFILGEVLKPGVFTVQNYVSVMEAVLMAGGLTDDAEEKNLLFIRGGMDNPTLSTINFNQLTEQGDLSQNVTMIPGDILYIPSSTIADVERFFVRLGHIISPIVNLERGIIFADDINDEVIRGDDGGRTIIIQ